MLNRQSSIHPLYPALTGIALLCACAAAPKPIQAPLNTDYSVRIEQAFEALPNGSHIDFQQGQRILPGNLDRWTTWCRLYVYNQTRGADYSTSVVPGRFAISEVTIAYHSSDYPGQLRSRLLSWGVRDYPAYYVYEVGKRLNSPDQPDVRSLICHKKWSIPRADQYPTLAQIRAALGNQILLHLPPTARTSWKPSG